MSHYTTLETRLVSVEHLRRALQDLGLAPVEVHGTAVELVGYEGVFDAGRAEVVVRREHLPGCSADLGFRRNAAGRLDAVVDAMDRGTLDERWFRKLTQRYAYHAAKHQLSEKGFELVEETVDRNDAIRLTLRRVA